MNNVFVPTANVNRCRQMCEELGNPQSLIGPSLAMISGRAGRGKTEFARHFATNSTAIYLPPLNIRTPAMVLREICFELCKARPRYTDQCLTVISDEMARNRRVVMIDEADLLPISILEMLRNINERYGCPIILIGEEQLKGKILSRRRLASRVRSHVEFLPVAQADIKLFYDKALGVDITPQITAILNKAADGDWRPVIKTAIDIERAMKASGLEAITEDLAKAVTNGSAA